MNKILNLQKQLAIIGIPILMIASIIFIVKSAMVDSHHKALSFGVTFDLLLTIPLVYYFLIRKTSIPKTTIILFLILGVIVGTFILPTENQFYLNLFKTWILPLLELTILTYVIYNIIKAIKKYKKREEVTFDFFTSLKIICYEIFPKRIAIFFAIEISTFYYGFIYWKKRTIKENEFSYHKDSGTIVTIIAFIFLIAIETFVFHLLLIRWSNITAWIFTFFSIYTAIQLFGFLKSMIKRPITIENNKLNLHYGIMNETIIDIKEISSIEITSKDIIFNKEIRKFSFLDSHNVIIKLKNEHTLSGLYGIKRKFRTLAIYVDEKEKFKNIIEKNLLQE